MQDIPHYAGGDNTLAFYIDKVEYLKDDRMEHPLETTGGEHSPHRIVVAAGQPVIGGILGVAAA